MFLYPKAVNIMFRDGTFMIYRNVSYQQLRTLAQDGDIVFFHRTNTLWSHLVAWATDSIFTHVNMVFWADIAGDRRLMCVEAAFGSKRRILNMSFYEDRTFTIVRSPVTWTDVAPTALERVGKVRYDNVGVVYVGVRDLLSRTIGVDLPAMDNRHEICSEFIARLAKLPETAVSPQGLYAALVTQMDSVKSS